MRCIYCKKKFAKLGLYMHEKACALNPKNVHYCLYCHNPVLKNKHDSGKEFQNKKFCSKICANKFHSGPNSSRWKPEVYRTTCYFYHGKQCIICDEKNVVEAHHLDEDRTNNSSENLIPLCPTHHSYWHYGFKHLIEQKIEEYITKWKAARATIPQPSGSKPDATARLC